MIDESKILRRPSNTFDWWPTLRPYIGQTVFAAGQDWIQYGMIDQNCCIEIEREVWFSGGVWRIGGKTLGKEEFFDILMKRNPDHAEFLLFHPEWF